MKNNAAKGLAVSSLSTIISFIIQTATTIVLARIFSPQQFGAIAAVAIITNYADIIWQLGLGPSIVQKKQLEKGDISTANIASISLGIILFIVVSLFAQPISRLVGLSNSFVLVIMALSFVLNSISAIPTSLLQRELLFSKIAVKDVSGNAIYFIMSVILGILGFGVWALVFATLIRYLVSLMLVLYYTRSFNQLNINRFSKRSFSAMMNFGIGYSISRFLNVTTGQIDYLTVSRTLGEVALGVYSKAFQLMSVPANLIGQVVDLVFFPIMAKSQEDNQNLERIFLTFTNIMALFCFPISVGLFLFANEFVQLFLGSSWTAAVAPLKMLGLSLFFRIGNKITDPLFRAKGAVYERALLHFIQAVMTGIGAFVGVKQGGITGVAIGVTISLILNYLFILLRVGNLLHIKVLRILMSVVWAMLLNYVTIVPLSYFGGFTKQLNMNLPVQFILLFGVWLLTILLVNIVCVKFVYAKGTLTLLTNSIKLRRRK